MFSLKIWIRWYVFKNEEKEYGNFIVLRISFKYPVFFFASKILIFLHVSREKIADTAGEKMFVYKRINIYYNNSEYQMRYFLVHTIPLIRV